MAYNQNHNQNRNQQPDKYQRSAEHKFVNPYIFVSVLSERNKKNRVSVQSYYGEDNLNTGILHCKMITRTPLAIPDVEKKGHKAGDPDKHYFYPFYRVDGKVTIPGSSIRGMIRSLYETATDSCFVTLRENEGLSTRVAAKTPYQAGILEKTESGWVLYEAKRYRVKIDNNPFGIRIEDGCRVIYNGNTIFENGMSVNVTTETRTVTLRNGSRENQKIVTAMSVAKDTDNHSDYVVIGEPIRGKVYESVFHCDRSKAISIDKRAMNGLENTVLIYQNASINKNLGKDMNTGYASFSKCKDAGRIPVWYKEENGKISLSMAAIGRKAYDKTVNDLVGEKHNPCQKRDCLCPACMLFGMAKDEAFGGRVRFSDALSSKGEMIPSATLQELGTPRTEYLPFYALKGMDYDAMGANIAGRKYYWHIAKADKDPSVYTVDEKLLKEPKTERNATMELASTGAEFTFDVYYDRITSEQLQELKWILTFGENSFDSSHMQKLGHGKPLGLGSVKIVVEKDSQRTFSEAEGYVMDTTIVPEKLDAPSRFSSAIQKQLMTISDFHILDNETVRYPYVEISDKTNGFDPDKKLKENVLANHRWFSANKGQTKNSPDPKLLPGINDRVLSLPAYYVAQLDDKDYERSPANGRPRNRTFGDAANRNSANVNNTGLPKGKGKIKFFNSQKGFGFIVGDDGTEYWYSQRDFPGLVINKTKNREAVSFKVKQGQKGPIAVSIEYI